MIITKKLIAWTIDFVLLFVMLFIPNYNVNKVYAAGVEPIGIDVAITNYISYHEYNNQDANISVLTGQEVEIGASATMKMSDGTLRPISRMIIKDNITDDNIFNKFGESWIHTVNDNGGSFTVTAHAINSSGVYVLTKIFMINVSVYKPATGIHVSLVGIKTVYVDADIAANQYSNRLDINETTRELTESARGDLESNMPAKFKDGCSHNVYCGSIFRIEDGSHSPITGEHFVYDNATYSDFIADCKKYSQTMADLVTANRFKNYSVIATKEYTIKEKYLDTSGKVININGTAINGSTSTYEINQSTSRQIDSHEDGNAASLISQYYNFKNTYVDVTNTNTKDYLVPNNSISFRVYNNQIATLSNTVIKSSLNNGDIINVVYMYELKPTPSPSPMPDFYITVKEINQTNGNVLGTKIVTGKVPGIYGFHTFSLGSSFSAYSGYTMQGFAISDSSNYLDALPYITTYDLYRGYLPNTTYFCYAFYKPDATPLPSPTPTPPPTGAALVNYICVDENSKETLQPSTSQTYSPGPSGKYIEIDVIPDVIGYTFNRQWGCGNNPDVNTISFGSIGSSNQLLVKPGGVYYVFYAYSNNVPALITPSPTPTTFQSKVIKRLINKLDGTVFQSIDLGDHSYGQLVGSNASDVDGYIHDAADSSTKYVNVFAPATFYLDFYYYKIGSLTIEHRDRNTNNLMDSNVTNKILFYSNETILAKAKSPGEFVGYVHESLETGYKNDEVVVNLTNVNPVQTVTFYYVKAQCTLKYVGYYGTETKVLKSSRIDLPREVSVPEKVNENAVSDDQGTYVYIGNSLTVGKPSTISIREGKHNYNIEIYFKMDTININNVEISGAWNHWKNNDHRFLCLEKITIRCEAENADKMIVRLSPALEAMKYTTKSGFVYEYRDFFKKTVSFPDDSTVYFNNNKASWSYSLPLANMTLSWKNQRLRSPYWIKVTFYKGSQSVTHTINDIEITGKVTDLIDN